MSQGLAFFVGIYFVAKLIKSIGSALFAEYLITYLLGFTFGLGLLISGMCRPSKMYSFLTLDYKHWDPSLLITFGTAMIVNLLFFPMVQGNGRPLLIEKISAQADPRIDGKLIAGAAMYGLGLGLTGLSPSTGMVNFFTMSYAIFWVMGLALG